MNIFYPVKNSSGKKNFPSFFKLFVTLLLCLAGVSVAQAENWYLRGSFNNTNWAESEDYKFEYKEVGTENGAAYRYILDVTFNSAGTDYFKLYWKDKTRWCGQGDVDNALKLEYCSFNNVGDLIWVDESKDRGGNIQFTHNEGTYRFIFDRTTNNLFVTGLVVTINPMTVNNEGYPVFSISYVNANPDKQIPTNDGYVVKFAQTYSGIGQNEVGVLQSGSNNSAGTYTFTGKVIETYANEYTYWGKIMTTNYDAAGSIHGDTYTYSDEVVTEIPTEPVIVTDFYVRGEKIGCTPSEGGDCWGVASEEFKATSKEGNVYVWDWISEPKLMVGPFKIADANFSDENNYGLENENKINLTDGKWTGTLQVNTASGDMVISEPGWNVSEITFDYDTKILEISATEVFKDIWFRSSIVEKGWGDDISDPIGSGVSPKYQGQTTDGKVYTWDWSGSKAVTLESGIEFKFGEYKGTSWAASGYAPNGQASVTSADFGKEISVQVAVGNFSAGEKITITKITLDTETLKLVLEGEKFTERFPVTVNTVNGEAGGTVTTEPADIGNMAIGETVTVTATANEGYVALFEATSGCVMTDGSADNIKVFEITEANPVITVTFQVQCQTVETGFTISGQFNKGVTDGGGLYEGTAVESGDADPKDGYWSDGARYIQLTANSVTANYFDWECVGYAIDNNPVETDNIPTINWTGNTTTSARAELSLPGTYTFVCNAKCNSGDDWTRSAELTITAPAPEMGFNGNIVTNHDWGTPSWAGQIDGGYMQRVKGSLVWKSNGFTVDGFGDNEAYHFVIEQRYKLLGCVTNEGWTEHNECGESGESEKDNKINRSNLSFTNVAFNDNTQGYNFIAINNSGWTAGVNGTKLQLVVTMNGYDSYKVSLQEYPEECQIQSEFEISARLNAGDGSPWEGNVVVSGSNTETGGYFADEHRTVTLSTSQVADNYEWVCVQYTIDGIQQTVNMNDVVTINNYDQQMATATLNLPGDYTFRCRAKCAADADYTESATVTISVYPAMGMDGPILDGSWPSHAIAGDPDHQLTRVTGSLVWSKSFNCSDNGGTTDNYQFVVIQQYKNGCVENQGWAGHEECSYPDGAKYNNKINDSNIEFVSNSVQFAGENNSNFVPVVTPSTGAELTLTVTMTGWDSYTVELSKKQEQIFANYSSNDANMGTVTMKVGDTQINNGDDITAYIGQQVTLTASPAPGYKVASWKINDKVTESDRTTITPKLSGDGLEVLVTFERDCYAGVEYDLTGGGVICAHGGSTELSLNTLNNVTYRLYKDGAPYGDPVQGNGEAAKWTISEAGTYTAKAYDSRHEDCQAQAMDMKGRAVVYSVGAPTISVNPGANVHLTVLQARSFTADVPVDWSITEVTGSGDYCEGNGYMISSKTDTSLVAKFLCIGTAKITAAMKDPNQNCKAEVTVYQNAAETEVCAPEPEDVQ